MRSRLRSRPRSKSKSKSKSKLRLRIRSGLMSRDDNPLLYHVSRSYAVFNKNVYDVVIIKYSVISPSLQSAMPGTEGLTRGHMHMQHTVLMYVGVLRTFLHLLRRPVYLSTHLPLAQAYIRSL